MTGWNRLEWIIAGGPLHRRRWYLLATAIAALIIAFTLLKPLLSARWSLIDDHETISYYDNSNSHGLAWYFEAVSSSETGRPGGGTRFRPVYFIIRLAETGLFAGSARLWWITHVLLFATSVLFLLWALRRLTAAWENLLATIWLIGAFTWWGDIFCRLGPSEAYCVPALALYAWGAISAIRTMRSGRLPRYHAWCGAALAIGGVVAAGSKENFVFLLLPSAYLIASARWRGSRRWIAVACAIQIAFGLFVAVAVYVGVARYGTVYKTDASTNGRLLLMYAAARELIANHLLAISAAVVALGGAFYAARQQRRTLARILAFPLAVIGLAFVIWLSQVAFYGGWPPTAGRYFVPGAFAAPIALYAGYLVVTRTARFFEVRAALVLRTASIIGMLWQVAHLNFDIRAQAVKMRVDSTGFSRKLNRIVKAAKKDPSVPIIFVSNTVWAYEPVDSLQIFIRHAHVTNPVYMINAFASSQFPDGSLERSLAEEMEKAARDGSKSLFPLTRPYAYQSGAPCIGVGLGGGTGLPACPAIATF